MTTVLVVLTFVGVLAVAVARALAIDEVKGRIQRRITARLDETIGALPDALQAEWADEWRAELASIITMPVSAAMFVRGVQRSAGVLVSEPSLVPASTQAAPPSGWRIRAQFPARARRFKKAIQRWMDTPANVGADRFYRVVRVLIVCGAFVPPALLGLLRVSPL